MKSKVSHISKHHFYSLKRGEEEGLNYYFHLYYPLLTYFCFQLTGDQMVAEDITCDSFVKLWNYRNQLLSESAVKSWLYNTVRNASIDYLRDRKRQKTYENDLVYLTEISEPTILSKLIEAETFHQLHQLMEKLPPKMRTVFKMFYLEGKSYQQIADELQVSIHTVRAQKARALQIAKESFSHLSCILLFLSQRN